MHPWTFTVADRNPARFGIRIVHSEDPHTPVKPIPVQYGDSPFHHGLGRPGAGNTAEAVDILDVILSVYTLIVVWTDADVFIVFPIDKPA